MLSEETLAEIASMVRSGFYEHDRVIEIFTEEMYEPGELDAKEVREAVNKNFSEYETEKKSYPETTDCDRLDDAFAGMNSRGVIALQNAGYTQTDGFEEVGEAYNELDDQSGVLGYCFYHGQDLQRAVNGDGLFFAFGPVDPADEQTVGIQVGSIVKEELERTGLIVDWDGTFESRLNIPKLNWQKR